MADFKSHGKWTDTDRSKLACVLLNGAIACKTPLPTAELMEIITAAHDVLTKPAEFLDTTEQQVFAYAKKCTDDVL